MLLIVRLRLKENSVATLRVPTLTKKDHLQAHLGKRTQVYVFTGYETNVGMMRGHASIGICLVNIFRLQNAFFLRLKVLVMTQAAYLSTD